MSAKGRSHDLAKSAFCAMPLFVAGAASVNLGSLQPFAATGSNGFCKSKADTTYLEKGRKV